MLNAPDRPVQVALTILDYLSPPPPFLEWAVQGRFGEQPGHE